MDVKKTLLNLLYPVRCVVCEEITGYATEAVCIYKRTFLHEMWKTAK